MMRMNEDVATFLLAVVGLVFVGIGFVLGVQFLHVAPNEGVLLWDMLYIVIAFITVTFGVTLFYVLLMLMAHMIRLIGVLFDRVEDRFFS